MQYREKFDEILVFLQEYYRDLFELPNISSGFFFTISDEDFEFVESWI